MTSVREILSLAEQTFTPGAYAIFDADGTLWASDIANRLYEHLAGSRRLRGDGLGSLNAVLRAAGLAEHGDANDAYLAMADAYARGVADERSVFEAMVTALAGFSLEELDAEHALAVGPDASRPIASDVHAEVPVLWAGLRELGYRMCVVSASPVWTVRYGLAQAGLDADDVRGGETELSEGRITERLLTPFTYREGKLEVARRDFSRDPCVGFGDGRGDLAFLEVCAVAVGINARPALRAALGARGRWLRCPRTVGGASVVVPELDQSTES